MKKKEGRGGREGEGQERDGNNIRAGTATAETSLISKEAPHFSLEDNHFIVHSHGHVLSDSHYLHDVEQNGEITNAGHRLKQTSQTTEKTLK